MADDQDIDAGRLEKAIGTDARLAADELKGTLEWIAETLGKPPQELVELVQKAGLDPKKLPGDDKELRERCEQLMHDARDVLGERVAEAEARVVGVYDAPAPLSPTACTKPGKRRQA